MKLRIPEVADRQLNMNQIKLGILIPKSFKQPSITQGQKQNTITRGYLIKSNLLIKFLPLIFFCSFLFIISYDFATQTRLKKKLIVIGVQAHKLRSRNAFEKIVLLQIIQQIPSLSPKPSNPKTTAQKAKGKPFTKYLQSFFTIMSVPNLFQIDFKRQKEIMFVIMLQLKPKQTNKEPQTLHSQLIFSGLKYFITQAECKNMLFKANHRIRDPIKLYRFFKQVYITIKARQPIIDIPANVANTVASV